MAKIITFLTILVTLTVNAFAKTELAKLGSIKVFKEEAELASEASGFGDFSKLNLEQQKNIINKVIDEKLIEKKAKQDRLNKKLEFESATRSILVYQYLNQYQSDIQKEAEKLYEASKQELIDKKNYTISHILVKTKSEAINIRKQIVNSKFPSKKFKIIAKNTSLDKQSGVNGGSLGEIPEIYLPKEIVSSAKNLKIGRYSQPIKTDFGFHVIIINKVEDVKIPEFKLVEQSFISQAFIKKFNEISTNLRNNKKVRFIEDNFNK